MNNLLKYGIGLAALGLTIYVAGVAWKRSQSRKNISTTGLLPSVDKPFIDNMPRVGEGMTYEQRKLDDLALQRKLDDLRKGKLQSDNMNAAGFFDGAFN